MRFAIPSLLLLAACAGGAPVAPGGDAAPEFTLVDDAGASVTGSTLWAGNRVLLAFMTSW